MLSIVISTRNRSAFLAEALSTYEQMRTSVPWELVVVDNGSTDDTPGTLKRLAQNATFPVQLLDEPTPGLARARNTGWRGAHGDIVAFTDDDCYPAPDFVDQVWTNFANSALGYLGGRVLLYDPLDYPITVQTRDTRLDFAPGRFVEPGVIHGANMAARKSVLELVKGFDDLLGAGTPFPSEDVDFLSRASASGIAGAYVPGPMVQHHHRRRTAEQVDRLNRSYDIGRGAYYASCLLDARRRPEAADVWYWTSRHRLSAGLGKLSGNVSTLRELRGAAGYAAHRAMQRLRGA